jgi:hypothetical protein
MTAAYYNHIKVCDILLEAGADFDEVVEVTDKLLKQNEQTSLLIDSILCVE